MSVEAEQKKPEIKAMMTFVLANRIVEAWNKDSIGMSVPGLLEYLESQNIFQNLKSHIRKMLAQANPKASDALWDKDLRGAIAALRKYGLVEHSKKWSGVNTRGYAISSSRFAGRFNSPQHDWKYIKPVRSR
jgi:hypothetical protein